jgi:hypothetical protein
MIKPEVLAAIIDEHTKEVLDGPLVKDRFAALEARIAELESAHVILASKALTGGLPWQRGTLYVVNDCVQHDGSLWRAIETHTSGSTFSHENFVLQIKRGRDGKDLR